MKKSLFLTASLLLSSAIAPTFSQAQMAAPIAPQPAASLSDDQLRAMGQGVAFPYERLDRVLRANVDKEGNVAYARVKGNNDLDIFVRALALADLTKFPNWMNPADPADPKSKPTPDRTPELVFWINAYNGLFLKAIADAYPVKSPTQIAGLDSAKTRVVAGKAYSFADLRRKIAEIDPRALFALPDGTKSGPRALSSVYRYTNLGKQLNGAITAFINDPTHVEPPLRLKNTVSVSPWLLSVEEWFKPKASRRKMDGARRLLSSYAQRNSDQNYFTAGDYEVKFLPTNASLNEQVVQ